MGFVSMAQKAAIELDVLNFIARAGLDARFSAAEITGHVCHHAESSPSVAGQSLRP